MSIAMAEKLEVGDVLLLDDVSWQDYGRMLWAFAERRGVKLTYDQGRLEIMAPLLMHDDDADLLGVFVYILTEELGLTLKRGGSTTLRHRKHLKGLEPDRCYWIANAPRMKGRRRLDLRTDPPPDLAIEVDVTASSLNRMNIYATLHVPEVWRLDDGVLSFWLLTDLGIYLQSGTSRAFPMISPADLMPFLKEAAEAGDENPVTLRLREWVRQRTAGGPNPPAAS